MPRSVTVVTGFLGSGKSTLLNWMLRSPDFANAAVIVNEFGEISIDHLLVEKAIDDALILRSGCICCTIRGGLVDTLLDLEARSARGEIPSFDRVVIETTGLADAAPVLQTVQTDFSLSGRYEVDEVVTTVDAVNALSQLTRFPEAGRQIAFAGLIALTKTDLADADQIAAVTEAVRRINPSATIVSVLNGSPADGRLPAAPAVGDIHAWLAASAYPSAGSAGDERRSGASRHAGIRSFSLAIGSPIELPRLKRWLLSLTSLRGRSILRIKGIVDIRAIEGPVVIHGIHHVFYPPVILGAWPDADRRSRIVIITEGLATGVLEATQSYLTKTG